MEGVKVSDNLQVVDDIAGSFDGDNSRSKGMIVCSDVDFSSDSWTDDADSVIGRPSTTPQTYISCFRQQVNMMRLRAHLNALDYKEKQCSQLVDRVREELRACRAETHHLAAELDVTFTQLSSHEAENNRSSVYRLTSMHRRLCEELQLEKEVEGRLVKKLEMAEHDLSTAELERGRLLLADGELSCLERQREKNKQYSAAKRVQRERSIANSLKMKESRKSVTTMKDYGVKEAQVVEHVERRQKVARRFLQKTVMKMRQRQREVDQQLHLDMGCKMASVVKLKCDIALCKENMKAVQARDEAELKVRKEVDDKERKTVALEGGNPDEVLLRRDRQLQQYRKQERMERRMLRCKADVMRRILMEDACIVNRRKRQPYLWADKTWEKSLRVCPRKPRGVKCLERYVKMSADQPDVSSDMEPSDNTLLENEVTESMEILDGEGEQGMTDMSRDLEEGLTEDHDLAQPEFKGLWEQDIKGCNSTSGTVGNRQPLGGSLMEAVMLKSSLAKQRDAIVSTQIAAGRTFAGTAFYSKPDVVLFKDFDVGKAYRRRVVITNVSYSINFCKLVDISDVLKDFVKVVFNPPGQMSAGLTCEMLVTFLPMVNQDLSGEISFLSLTGPFSIPVRCARKKCELHLSMRNINFGSTVINETVKRSLTLTNRGALGTAFTFFKVITFDGLRVDDGRMENLTADLGTCLEQQSTLAVGEGGDSVSAAREVDDDSEGAAGSGVHRAAPEDIGMVVERSAACVCRDADEDDGGVDEAPIISETATGKPPADVDESCLKAKQESSGTDQVIVGGVTDDFSLYGMRVGSAMSGDVNAFTSVTLEIIWQPTVPGKVESEFRVAFTDPSLEELSVLAVAEAVDVPVWLEERTVDLRICMFDRLYQETVIVHNRATAVLKVTFDVCPEVRNYLEVLPKTAYVQALSQFSAQLKFFPRKALFDVETFFDKETSVLETPVVIKVANQSTPVTFTVSAVLTTTDIDFSMAAIDFGHCTVYEAVRTQISLTNRSLLPQQFGFCGVPEFVDVQPNDGFGTLLPLETYELDIEFSPSKAMDYKFELVCKSIINRSFKIDCVGVGVLPPLRLSHQVARFAATALYDVATADLHVVNHHMSSNEFTHPVPRIGSRGDVCPVGAMSFEFVVPDGVPVALSPTVGTVLPGQAASAIMRAVLQEARIQLLFSPTLDDSDIRQEAVRLANEERMERALKEYEEALKQEKTSADQATQESSKGGKNAKGRTKGSRLLHPPSSSRTEIGCSVKPPSVAPVDPGSFGKHSVEYRDATVSLLRNFGGFFCKVVVPCYVAPGQAGHASLLPYSVHNTLYLEIHCPVVRPHLIVISNHGNRVTDFGDNSIGQISTLSITVQNISDQTVPLISSALDTTGPFLVLNAMRELLPGATHTMIISFTPTIVRVFQETLDIGTTKSVLRLTLLGRGVQAAVHLSVGDGVLDMGAVLVNQYGDRVFKIQNISSLAIDFLIKLDSLSSRRHTSAQRSVHIDSKDFLTGQCVGVQNYIGGSVFDVVPTQGSVRAGETKAITVTFAPDHESSGYSDGVHVELFGQDERHSFLVRGQAKPHILYVDGCDPINSVVESLAVSSTTVEADEESTAIVGVRKKGSKTMPPVQCLITMKSSFDEDGVYLPASRSISVGCVRTMAVSQKKNGEFQFENVQRLSQRGFSVDPQRGLVEAGTRRAVSVKWHPAQDHDPSQVVEETVVLTLKSDVTEQYHVMLRAIVVAA